MAKKEIVQITLEGLKLLTVLNYSSIAEINGFYGKEVYFTDGFNSEILCLFQALGNVGAFARNKELEGDIHCIIVSNIIMNNPDSELYISFVSELQEKLNQNNSPFRRIKIFSEDQLIWYMENRAKITNDSQLSDLIKRYKSSIKQPTQQQLF